jgi:penicillin-binding protein 2
MVSRVRDAHDGSLKAVPSELVRSIPISPDHLRHVREAMVDVTRPGGTAAQAGAGAPYAFAGKTGTAQVVAIKQGESYDASRIQERHRDHAWFIAFAPADKPTIAIAVLVENGGGGSTVAAPIARQVVDYWLLGKRPDGSTLKPSTPAVEEEHD